MNNLSTTEAVHRALFRTYEEALSECVSKELTLVDHEEQLRELSELLGDEMDGDDEPTLASVTSGVRSLVELMERLYGENARLRAELAKVVP